MAVALFLLFVVLPIVELAVLVQVASAIGVLPAIALVLAMSFAGLWLVKRQGIGVARRAQAQLQRGEVPAAEVVNAVLLLVAGLLLLFPGYVTAVAGLLLLVPPVRALARRLVLRRWSGRIDAGFAGPAGTVFRTGFAGTRATRVFTGGATYGGAGVVDVREVPDPGPTGTDDPPALGRY